MDINHPLYYVLKDYYTNLDLNSSNIDNSLLIQYIEDTYKIKDDNKSDNYDCFKSHYLECDSIYYVNMIKTSKALELYCYFTNKFLNKFSRFCIVESCSDAITDYGMAFVGKYNFIYCKVKQNNYMYLYMNTTTLEKN